MTTAEALGTARALGVTAGVIALAFVGWMSAADRATATSTHPEQTYFGGAAATQIAFTQLAGGNPEAALSAARRAVRTAPVDPATTSALGSSLLALGQIDQAYTAFAVAGALGWREVPTQLYWLAQAEAAGDEDILAQRLDALLRLDIDNEAIESSLNVLGQTKVGQQALATLLMKDPPWERRFLIETGALEGADLEGRIAAIEHAARQGASFDCEAVGRAANTLIHDKKPKIARYLWQQACERSGGTFLSDGGFEANPSITSNSPFTWQLRSEGGLDVAVQPAPNPLRGRALRIHSSLTARTIAARQVTTLQPGQYRLSWTSALENGNPDTSIAVLVRCEGAGELNMPRAAGTGVQPNRNAITFSVPEQGCPIQIVAVQKAASGLGEKQAGWIDDIAITPIGDGDAVS